MICSFLVVPKWCMKQWGSKTSHFLQKEYSHIVQHSKHMTSWRGSKKEGCPCLQVSPWNPECVRLTQSVSGRVASNTAARPLSGRRCWHLLEVRRFHSDHWVERPQLFWAIWATRWCPSSWTLSWWVYKSHFTMVYSWYLMVSGIIIHL